MTLDTLIRVVFGPLYLTGAGICLASAWFRHMAWAEAWWHIWPPLYTFLSLMFDIHALIRRDWTGVAIYTVFGVLVGWQWWNDDKNRRKRKKLAQRVAGRVVATDAGLKVQPNEG